jgi:sugar/nucleoside kinase (ribokinase family)
MADDRLDVTGIGNAIVDVLSDTDDAFLGRQGLAKGSMTLIDADRSERLYSRLTERVECSGGSAANTVVGLASLGGRAAYVGKVRDDSLGQVFIDDLRAAGVTFRTPPATSGPPTGRCLVLVTPDAQRTMLTFLGASATLTPADLDEDAIASARITYLEGYLWDPPPAKEAFLTAAGIAHRSGARVALSLSDSFCVERHRQEFRDLVERHVDVVLANEAEVLSLYETTDFDRALDALAASCGSAAVTRGAVGSVILDEGRRVEVQAEPVERVVDTTGAGDLFASGFLLGLARNLDPESCGRIGSIAAAEIIGHFGARPASSLAERVGGASGLIRRFGGETT